MHAAPVPPVPLASQKAPALVVQLDEGTAVNSIMFAPKSCQPSVPFVVRLDGTNDEAGRTLLAEAALPNVHPARTMNEAAEMVVALAAGSGVAS